MDFTYSIEQQLLDQTVTRWARECASTRRPTQRAGNVDGAAWRMMTELGLLGLPFAAADGGLAGGGIELMILHRAIGRALVQVPYLSTVVLGGGLLGQLADASLRANLLPQLIAGHQQLALAYLEPAGRYQPFWSETRAVPAPGGYRMSGHKAVVLHADSADQLIVVAREHGQRTEREGLSAFLIDARHAGVEVQGYPTIDGRRAAEVRLNGVHVQHSARLGLAGGAGEALEQVLAAGAVALCAEAVGSMEAACELTRDHLQQRKQFGVPIGRFQVLQHRLVDMHVAFEKALSMTMLAACSLQLPSHERALRTSSAKCLVAKAAHDIAEEAIQLHGGLGMTDEALISHHAKHLVMMDHWLGDADYHLTRFIELADQPA
jgi:alkylation response protein AidB-like acyl-CoA dehydrogenase